MTPVGTGPVCARCASPSVSVDPHPCDDCDQNGGKELPGLPGSSFFDLELARLRRIAGRGHRSTGIRGHHAGSIVTIHQAEMPFEPPVTSSERCDWALIS